MDGASTEVIKQRNQKLEELRKGKESQLATVVNQAKDQEAQLTSALDTQTNHYTKQLNNVNIGIGQLETALNSGLSGSEASKARSQLEKLRAHRNYIQGELFRLKVRMRSRINTLWFHVRTQKEFINQNADNQRSLLLKKYADLLTHVTNNSMIQRANARAQQQARAGKGSNTAGGRPQARKPNLGMESRGSMQQVAG